MQQKKKGMEVTAAEERRCREHCQLELRAWLACGERQNIIDWAMGNTSWEAIRNGPCQSEQKAYEECIAIEKVRFLFLFCGSKINTMRKMGRRC